MKNLNCVLLWYQKNGVKHIYIKHIYYFILLIFYNCLNYIYTITFLYQLNIVN